MKVLYTTPILEYPPAGGPQLRIANSIKALGRVAETHVVSRVRQKNIGGPEAERFFRGFCTSFSYSPSASAFVSNRWARLAQARFEALGRAVLAADVRDLLGRVDRLGIDVVWFGYGNISYSLMKAVRAARPNLKLVCDTDSVWSRFVLRELPFIQDEARRREVQAAGQAKVEEERDWTNFCDVTTGVSDVDVEYYESIATDPRRVRRFSNVIDLDDYRRRVPPPPNYHTPCLYLAGTFGHRESPMDVAARWVVDEVLPRVRDAVPGIHLYIVGSRSDLTLGHLNGPTITVTGKVPTVLPYLFNATVALVPLKFESGTRFKILEAAACDVPIVSTTLGAEGIPVRDGEHCLLADDADAFARAILALVTDPARARHLAAGCRDLVEREFSVPHLALEARGILDFLGSAQAATP